MTDRWGVDNSYEDAHGVRQTVAPDVVARVRGLVGEPEGTRASRVVFSNRKARTTVGPGVLTLEDGGELVVDERGVLPHGLPLGYHRFTPRDATGAEDAVTVITSPGRCHLPAGWRAWGWAVQLYASRSRRSWGCGDLGDLAALATWSAERHGAGFVMVNPLHAAAPGAPQEPSPYSPTSRRFRNPLYICVEDVPGGWRGPELDELAARGRALNASRLIDRDEVQRLKLRALELLWTHSRREPEFEAWRARQGAALEEFATWNVLAEQFGRGWRTWPDGYRRSGTASVAEFARVNAPRVTFHSWLQFVAERQLSASTDRLAVIQDLPIGFDPDGADAWSWQDLVAAEASVGAPPDEFNTAGQDWSLPPFIPSRLRAAAYRPFIETVRATMPAGGGLRIDHIMGLFRLWWIPRDDSPRHGAYVRYPSADLLDIVALESHRAGALVVGEDLGTVERGVREEMAHRSMLSYRLLWFEDEDPARWPARSMAAVTTHDLPTVAGMWDGSDVEAQRRTGIDPNEDGWAAIRRRLRTATALAQDASVADACVATYDLLARAPSVLLSATLDDAAAERERPNMPGGTARANWCLALADPIEELMTAPLPARIAGALRRAVEPQTAEAPAHGA